MNKWWSFIDFQWMFIEYLHRMRCSVDFTYTIIFIEYLKGPPQTHAFLVSNCEISTIKSLTGVIDGFINMNSLFPMVMNMKIQHILNSTCHKSGFTFSTVWVPGWKILSLSSRSLCSSRSWASRSFQCLYWVSFMHRMQWAEVRHFTHSRSMGKIVDYEK